MHTGRIAAVLLTLSLMPGVPLSAQQPPEPTVAAMDTVDRTAGMVAAGLLGGAIGMFVGGAVGAGTEKMFANPCGEYCGLGGALLGGLVGESMGMAFGVHTANSSRGGYIAALAGPVVVLAGSVALGSMLGDDVPALAIVVVVPTAQLMTSIGGERAAMRRRARAPN